MITAQQLGLIEKSPIVSGTLQAVSDEHGDGGVDFEEFVRDLTTKLVISLLILGKHIWAIRKRVIIHISGCRWKRYTRQGWFEKDIRGIAFELLIKGHWWDSS